MFYVSNNRHNREVLIQHVYSITGNKIVFSQNPWSMQKVNIFLNLWSGKTHSLGGGR